MGEYCMHEDEDPACCEGTPGEELYKGILSALWYCRSYLLSHDMVEVMKPHIGWAWVFRDESERMTNDGWSIVTEAIELF